MLTRAGRSLRAAFRRWNNAANWDWTKVVDSSITSTAGTSTYALPYDIKTIYDVRYGEGPLYYANRRIYDRLTTSQTSTSTPSHYDLFRKGTQGYIELMPSPGDSATLVLKYYRLLTQPCAATLTCTATTGSNQLTTTSVTGITIGSPVSFSAGFAAATYVKSIDSATTFSVGASATAASTASVATVGGDAIPLDIPMQYIDGVLAAATHHFLANKAGGMDRGRLDYWFASARDEIALAVRTNNNVPDEDLAFIPSYAVQGYVNYDDPNIKDFIE